MVVKVFVVEGLGYLDERELMKDEECLEMAAVGIFLRP
jgi:hypothetical protein